MNMYRTGSARPPFNAGDIKALPAAGGDPQCNTQADVEAAPLASLLQAQTLHCQPWGGCGGPGPAWGSSCTLGFRGTRGESHLGGVLRGAAP